MILENISYAIVETGRIELQTFPNVDSFSRLENEWDLLSAKCSNSTIINSTFSSIRSYKDAATLDVNSRSASGNCNSKRMRPIMGPLPGSFSW